MSDKFDVIKEIKSKCDFEECIKSPLVFIKFIPVIMIRIYIPPIFEEKAKELSSGSIIFAKCQIEHVPELADYCKSKPIPCCYVFKNGEKIEEVDELESEKLIQMIDKYAKEMQ